MPLQEWIKNYIYHIYNISSYVKFLQMELTEVKKGEAELSMLVRHELTNLSGILHGGAIGSLHDTAMKLVCYSLGKKAVILGFNTNFLGRAKKDETVKAFARVIHNGKSTIIVESRILSPDGNNIALARGTFLVIGSLNRQETEKQIMALRG